MTEYLGWVKTLDDARDGQEMELLVQDLTPGKRKYDSEIVRAVIASSRERLPGADVLWLRTALGRPVEKPWYIKIVKRLGVGIKGRPYALSSKPEV